MALSHSQLSWNTEAIKQARTDLAAAYRSAVLLGFNEGIDNHFSLLLPGRNDLMLLNPYPLHWSEITASNLLIVDFDGNLIDGSYEVEPTAFHIHAPLHRANQEEFRCILHTHMPYATALACQQNGRLEMVHQNSTRFADQVAYLDTYDGLILDTEAGEHLARVMGNKPILFMANHGVITAGRTVAAAFDRLYFLERACQLQILAGSGENPRRLISPRVTARLVEQRTTAETLAAERLFAAFKRRLDREEPGYKS
jgi:ribulose-5-phosphate 4-epimerase/fuculose-1-phosphate aldolase